MGSLSSKNKNFKYLLSAIHVYSKYAWVKPLKVKKEGREFCSKCKQEQLNNNNNLIYSTHNEDK